MSEQPVHLQERITTWNAWAAEVTPDIEIHYQGDTHEIIVVESDHEVGRFPINEDIDKATFQELLTELISPEEADESAELVEAT